MYLLSTEVHIRQALLYFLIIPNSLKEIISFYYFFQTLSSRNSLVKFPTHLPCFMAPFTGSLNSLIKIVHPLSFLNISQKNFVEDFVSFIATALFNYSNKNIQHVEGELVSKVCLALIVDNPFSWFVRCV